MSGRRITVTIDRLALRGVDPRHAQALADGLKTELARALAESGSLERLRGAQGAPVLRLRPAPLDASRAGARRFGANLARAIGKGTAR